MSSAREDTDPDIRVAVRFQEMYWRDRDAGRRRPLSDYLDLFPDRRSIVVREYLAAEGAAAPAAPLDEVAGGDAGPGPEGRIGPYRIVREIGRGGQGVVYLADDVRLERKVALKVLARAGELGPEAILRFHREAAVASRLDHPGICAVYDVGRERGSAYIAMRYVDGRSLAALIADERARGSASGVRGAVDLVARAARALHAAHEAGIVHRDVKPGNVMIGRDGQPVILDFGIARDESPSAVTLTGTGDLFGTPAYLAPEQIEPAARGVDRRADVYALGVTLYEALTLTRPFEAPTRVALYREILRGDPVDPRRLDRAISPDLAVCVLTAMERDRDRRYQTAAAFADDLEALRAGRPIAARPLGAAARLVRWARREPARAAVLALLAIGLPVLAALGSYVYATRDSVAEADRARLGREVEDRLEHGFFELGEGDPQAARAAFEAALRLEPSSVEARAGLELLDRSSSTGFRPAPVPQDLEPSVAAFLAGARALDDVHGGRLSARQAAFDAFETAIRQSRHARALYFFEAMHAAGHLGDLKLIARYRDALRQLWPDSAMTRFYVATSLKHEGKREEARRLLEALAREHPGMAQVPIALGAILASLDRHQESAAAFRAALAISPASPNVHLGLGRALQQLGDYAGAVAELREAVRLSPREPQIRANLASALFDAGDPQGSEEEFRNALRLSPEKPWEVRNVLAARLLKSGRVAEALEESRAVVAGGPGYANGWLNLGLALARMGEHAEALAAFEKVVELLPGDCDGLENVAITAGRLKRFERALEAGREAVRQNPERARSHYVLGLTLQGVDDDAGAAEAFAAATRLDPGYAEAWCNHGLRLRELGRVEEAAASLRRGHELAASRPDWTYPSAKWLADCERQLALERGVAATLVGESRPVKLAQWVALAKYCHDFGRREDEAALLEKAMSGAEPEVRIKLRHQAARCALRAAGLGSADSRPESRRRGATSAPASRPDREGASRRALAWLGDELSFLESAVAEGDLSQEEARRLSSRWLADADLRLLQDPAAAGLDAADVASWRALRARLDAFLTGK